MMYVLRHEVRDVVRGNVGWVQAPLSHLCSPGRHKQLNLLNKGPQLPQQLSLQ